MKIYRVDDLKEIVTQNVNQRQQYAKEAYKIVSNYTVEFFKWLDELSVEPFIKQLRFLADEAVEKELVRCFSKGYLPKEQEQNIKKAMQSSFNRFLHNPTKMLRNSSKAGKTDQLLESLQAFFDLQDLDSIGSNNKCNLKEE